ncbi:IgG-blocking protein M [Mycoplasmoides pirum]|uniref:IgG-blocking protein M n=1 Tax=Mycoplasmoides pirum TaxID=2122 RepID=UPI00047FFF55|nr:IgG-blocking protein M [Mycoplasmoides pirum]
MTKNKKVSKKFLSLLLGGLVLSATAAIAIAVPLITTSNNKSLSIGESGGSFVNGGIANNGQQTTLLGRTNNLKFSAVKSTDSILIGKSKTTNVVNEDNRYNEIVKQKTVDGREVDVKVSKSYNNNRKYMPILAYNDEGERNYYGFTQSRSANDVRSRNFPGWQKTNVNLSAKLYDNSSYAQAISNVYMIKFQASEVLKNSLSKDNNLVDTSINALNISFNSFVKKYGDNAQSLFERIIKENNISYLIITDVFDDNIKNNFFDLSKYDQIKKLDISGRFTSIDEIKFPTNLLELSISSESEIISVDPLQIPMNAAMIHEQGFGVTFTNINLSKHKNLSTEDFQKAIDIVYIQRIRERAFQGNFSGGYIFSWNLRGTGITTLNNVTVPKLDDGTGRFYIARVEIETDAGMIGPNGEINVVVPDGNKPSNDSQVTEWYDWNQEGLMGVKTVIVSSISGAKLDFDTLVNEILGFTRKYPNVEIFDISSIQLSDTTKSLDDVATAVKNKLTNPFGETKEIGFITHLAVHPIN